MLVGHRFISAVSERSLSIARGHFAHVLLTHTNMVAQRDLSLCLHSGLPDLIPNTGGLNQRAGASPLLSAHPPDDVCHQNLSGFDKCLRRLLVNRFSLERVASPDPQLLLPIFALLCRRW